MGYLERSSALYDQGHTDEAIRIALTLRVLFHQTNSSISMLTHLRATQISLLSSQLLGSRPIDFEANITAMNISMAPPEMYFVPLLDGTQLPLHDDGSPTAVTQRQIPWRRWWDSETVYKTKEIVYTRRDLVLAAANNDGGAHVAKELTIDYLTAKLGLGWGMAFTPVKSRTFCTFLHATFVS